MNLSEIVIGKKVKILEIECANKVKERLFDMGIDVGVDATLIRKAPLGDPLEYKIKDFYIAIRKLDAKKISVRYYE